MLDKDNILSKSVSEAVQKISIVEKDYRKCTFMCFICTATAFANAPLCVLLCTAIAYKEQLCTATDQHAPNIEIVVYLLGCI